MLRIRTLSVLGTLSLSLFGAAACRSTPQQVPSSSSTGPAQTASVSHHDEPVDLVPVGLGGGPPESSSDPVVPLPGPVHSPAPHPGKKLPHPSTTPTWSLPPFPSAWPAPSTWWQVPTSAPSTTAHPAPGTPQAPAAVDAGKDF